MDNITRIIIASRYEKDQKLIISAIPETMGFKIIGIENDESETIIRSQRLQPDILIIDFNITIITGTELLPIIRRLSPLTSIILLCEDNKDDHVMLAIRAGISGYLLKDDDMEKLAHIIKIVIAGGFYINDSIIKKYFTITRIVNQLPKQFFINKLADLSGNAESFYPIFSSLERDIITKMVQGYSDDQIAKKINYNKGTIRNVISDIRRKTKLKTRAEIIIFSVFYGLIHLENLTPWFNKADIIFKGIIGQKKLREEEENMK